MNANMEEIKYDPRNRSFLLLGFMVAQKTSAPPHQGKFFNVFDVRLSILADLGVLEEHGWDRRACG